MFNFRKPKPVRGTQAAETEPLVIRLEVAFTEAVARDERAKQAADYARANLASIAPADLQAALIEENEARAALADTAERLRVEKAAIQARQEAENSRREQLEREAKRQAFSDALMAYRAACATLYPQALEVRRLAKEAGEYLQKPNANDLLFDDFSEPHVAGVDVPLWRKG
ncbi:hypothetical protein [Chromobacterium sp. ASV23]|uniref:hypothetical protein n=1 Tax=Chromobacterium sp. ASV23 TaxID=2795110 RepID=UPI0018EDAD8C|nr:hypothetical protein [Chromobacterium sp. ASV23]